MHRPRYKAVYARLCVLVLDVRVDSRVDVQTGVDVIRAKNPTLELRDDIDQFITRIVDVSVLRFDREQHLTRAYVCCAERVADRARHALTQRLPVDAAREAGVRRAPGAQYAGVCVCVCVCVCVVIIDFVAGVC
jgi:hypothetical protein